MCNMYVHKKVWVLWMWLPVPQIFLMRMATMNFSPDVDNEPTAKHASQAAG